MVMQKQQPKKTRKAVSILIVDDHPIVRQGLENLLSQEKSMEVCAQAEDAYKAMKAIRELKPDIIVVDISLQDKSGLELIKDIHVQYPDMPILALSMHDENLYAERVLRAGAKGYVMKQQAAEKVIDAIKSIMNGQIYVSEKIAAKMMRKLVGVKSDMGLSMTDRLSDRELEVFLLIGKGYGTRQISEKLHLSIKTIESYRAHIKEKLNLADATELLQYAIQWAST
jgi:DNA-binding NarL/FixJ family response regulator